MDPLEFKELVIVTTLQEMDSYIPGMYSEEAVMLLLGTVLMESRIVNLKQKRGPALGVYQIEPTTAKDVFIRYSQTKENLHNMVLGMFGDDAYTKFRTNQLVTDLRLATVVARLKYWMQPTPLPKTIEGLAKVWDGVYNTNSAKGFPEEFVKRYKDATGT